MTITGKIDNLNPELLDRLNRACSIAKVPFYVTSGWRTPEENQAVDGVMNSSHTRGLAVDVACVTSQARLKMVSAFIIMGFKRIGVYSRHIHVDTDGSLPQEVLWYGNY